jgi:hypothetical protein
MSASGSVHLYDGAVEVFPNALDVDVRLVHAPAAADRGLVLPGHFLDVFHFSATKASFYLKS